MSVDKPKTYSGDLDNLPDALAPLCIPSRWVGWRWTLIKNKQGVEKWTKPPYRAANPAAHASSTDPDTWDNLATALSAVKDGKADGIGFALKDTYYGAVDLDDCRDPKTSEIDQWAQDTLALVHDVYVEVTPSGTGLRIVGYAEKDELDTKWKVVGARERAQIELYRHSGRYITITGLQIGDCRELTNIDALLDDLDKRRPGGKRTNGTASPNGNGHDHGLFDTDDLIVDGAPVGQRSEAFARVVWSLAGTGCSADKIERALRAHPSGIAEKYLKPKDRTRGSC